tara:strand:+ start:4420 stop:5031 length:612 start_codon:yes stop_codon:yes gene_type:complete
MALLKRLEGEIRKLPLGYDLVIFEQLYSTDLRSCKLTFNSFTVHFELPKEYPFKGPFRRDITFALQGKMFSYDDVFRELCTPGTCEQASCLSCRSLTCPENWIPTKTLFDVFNEIVENIQRLEADGGAVGTGGDKAQQDADAALALQLYYDTEARQQQKEADAALAQQQKDVDTALALQQYYDVEALQQQYDAEFALNLSKKS